MFAACVRVGYQQVHHVWLVVSQSFNSVKDVDAALLSQHFTDYTDTAEHPAATAAIPDEETVEDTRTHRVEKDKNKRWEKKKEKMEESKG